MPAMSFDLQVVHSVQEIGQAAWDALAGDRPFASYRWYRFGEAVLADDKPIYIILSLAGEPVARGTFWLKREQPVPVSSRAVRRLLRMVFSCWPLMVCKSPLASISGLLLPDDPDLRDAALGTIARVAQAQGKQHRASFVFFDYLDTREIGWPGWPSEFLSLEVPESETRLVITWSDFGGYLSSLSKSARKDYRRHCNRAADLGIDVHYQSAVDSVDQALVLIHTVERRHNSDPSPWTRRMLENIGMVDATWLVAEVEGRLVGCGLLLGDGGYRFLASLGLDYDVEYVYFQLMYEAIRGAIEAGARVLRGGSGAYEMKRRLGFDLESNNHVMYTASSRGIRWLAHRLAAS